MNRKALEEKRVDLQAQMSSIIDTAKAEQRALTEAEENEFAKCEEEIREIDEKIESEDKEMNVNETRSEVEIRESKQFVDYVRGALENRADVNFTQGGNGAIIPKTIANKVIKPTVIINVYNTLYVLLLNRTCIKPEYISITKVDTKYKNNTITASNTEPFC